MFSSLEQSVLYLVLFSLFVLWGMFAAEVKDKYYFGAIAVIPILSYALIVGSRYGWGPDYLWYKLRYEQAFIIPEDQIGFRYLNQTMLRWGVGYVGCFFVYSLIFMVSSFRLMRDYAVRSKYMYAFVIPATLQMVSNGIRQGLALSFILLTISSLNRKKWLQIVIWTLVGASIHSSVVVTMVMVLLFWLFLTKPLDWKVTVPLYLFFAYVYDVSKTGFVAKYIQMINLGGHFQGYAENADYWFGQDAANDVFRQSAFALLMYSLFCVSFIYLGHVAFKSAVSKNVTYLYNVVVIGMIFYRAVFLFEILRRFAEPLVMLYFVPLGYIVYVFLGSAAAEDISKAQRGRFNVGFTLILLYLFFYWGRFTFLNPDALFFWNVT